MHRSSIAGARRDVISPIFWWWLRPAALLTLVLATALSYSADAPSRNRLLLLSDIHFNPLADSSLVRDLSTATPEQWEAILQHSKLTAFSQYGQDTNWWLLRSALDQMHANLPSPALLICTGDLLAHSFRAKYVSTTGDNAWEDYRVFVLKTVEFLALELEKRFNGIPLLLTPGNNDDDCGDYAIEPNGVFLNDTADLVGDLAKGDAELRHDWRMLGSYATPHPTVQGLRIISLNTVFLSTLYKAQAFSTGCQPAPSNGASDLLDWLHVNLDSARQHNQHVWLMFHIPPGIDGYATTHPRGEAPQASSPPNSESCAAQIVPMWVPEWSAQFVSLLANYRDVVIAGFAGHTHMDDFRLIHTKAADDAFVLITPALSPIYDQNPSFRIVNFRSDGAVVGQSTYYLTNLKEATSTNRGRWKREYRFSRKWKVPQLNLNSLAKIYSEVENTAKARDQWEKLYMVSSTTDSLTPAVVRGLYCAIGSLDAASYQACYCPANVTSPGAAAPKF